MSMGPGARDLEGIFEFLKRCSPFERDAHGLDGFFRYLGEIGEGSFSDRFPFSVGFPQKDSRWRASIGYFFDIHGYNNSTLLAIVKPYYCIIHGYIYQVKNPPICLSFRLITADQEGKSRGNFRLNIGL